MAVRFTEDEWSREIKSANRFIITSFIITSLLTASVVCFLIYCGARSKFSVKRWREQPESRKYMINSLLLNNEIYGMSESEIYTLLGTEASSSKSFSQERRYYLGSSKRTNQEHWLVLQFENGLVDTYKLETK